MCRTLWGVAVGRVSIDAAERFVWLNARLIDRFRFDFLFRNGERGRVLAQLRLYRNSDGGFGNGLEPDLRGPTSQPMPAATALWILDELDAMDDPMVASLLDYLSTITAADGGVPFVLPSVRDYPRAPWWNTSDDPPGSLNPTATLAGLLYKHSITHPWLERATEFCWEQIGCMSGSDPYEGRAVLPFLDHVPDRERAENAFERVAAVLTTSGAVTLDPDAPGEVHLPLDFAPAPQTLARRMFSDEMIERHLDALEKAQRDDGGWDINWMVWTPATGPEWRGWQTVHVLQTLRAYGRV